jgi:hypothetical protein
MDRVTKEKRSENDSNIMIEEHESSDSEQQDAQI